MKLKIQKIFFLYEGKKIDEEMKLNQISTNKELNILVNCNTTTTIINKQPKKTSKLIICPECGQYCTININDYKINLEQCDNRHSFSNILLDEFNNTQIIDESKIKCSNLKMIISGSSESNPLVRGGTIILPIVS